MSPELGHAVRLIPLGGLGEFGLNSMLVEWGENRLLVDAGMMFPHGNLPGIDSIVPDFETLEKGPALSGIILTHGHEDHLGGLPFALKSAPAPVYGSRYTLALAKRRLREREVSCELNELSPGRPVELGPFRIHPVEMTHSVPQSCGLVIETPGGTLVFTGDFKLGGPSAPRTDVATLAEWGQRGVLALLSDSTNIELQGFTEDEESVRPAFEGIFERTSGRVLVSCFATAIARIALVAEVAIQHGRKLAFIGRRMVENVESAIELGLLSIPNEALCTGASVAQLPRSQVALFVSGSQGEPLSALSLISAGVQRDIRVEAGDRVVFAARVIPGNERAVSHLIGNLYRHGCDVDHPGTARVHVSGHGCREDAREMLRLVRPRHVIPVHGEFRMLAQHARLALAEGYPPERVHLVEDGQALALAGDDAVRLGNAQTGRVLLDRAGLEEIADEVVQDRRHISAEGIVVPIVVIDRDHGEPLSQPEIVTRGLTNGDEALQRESRQLVITTFGERTAEERNDLALTRERLRIELRRLFKRRTGRRPMVIPVIMEV